MSVAAADRISAIEEQQIKKFVFGGSGDRLEILIPELVQASYSCYTWPSAPVLAWFLWEHRSELIGQRVLELGSGTALPGIVAAKCGAAQVILTDSLTLPKALAHIERSCHLNQLPIGEQVRIVGLTWGLFLGSTGQIGPIDLILASDCFYEPATFEDLLATVSHLLDSNPGARFLCTYQERSSDWSIEHLLNKWNLVCSVLNTRDLGSGVVGFDLHQLTGDHTIHLLEIRASVTNYGNSSIYSI